MAELQGFHLLPPGLEVDHDLISSMHASTRSEASASRDPSPPNTRSMRSSSALLIPAMRLPVTS